MTSPSGPLTSSLAKVYADQGLLDKAAEIYRHLLANAPDRTDYASALAEIEIRLSREPSISEAALAALMSSWIELTLGVEKLERLSSLRPDRSGE